MFLSRFTESAEIKVKKMNGKLIEKNICIAKEIGEMKLQSRQDKMKHFSSLKLHAKEKNKRAIHLLHFKKKMMKTKSSTIHCYPVVIVISLTRRAHANAVCMYVHLNEHSSRLVCF